MKKKFSHKVFHLEKDVEIETYFKKMNKYLAQFSEEIDTPTIHISSSEEINYFYKNSIFRFNPTGYEFAGEKGWKYGEIGIWYSTIFAYVNFLEKTDSDYLILDEDDIEYKDGFFDNLVIYLSQIKVTWDVFFY